MSALMLEIVSTVFVVLMFLDFQKQDVFCALRLAPLFSKTHLRIAHRREFENLALEGEDAATLRLLHTPTPAILAERGLRGRCASPV
jgi:hypothetical protein